MLAPMSGGSDDTFDVSTEGGSSSIAAVEGSSGMASRAVPAGPDQTLCATEDPPKDAPKPPQSRADRLQRGDGIGRYLVLDRLGAGAMGEVLAAYDPDLDRKVAIKLIKPRGWDSEVARARLHREAQALAKLRHPNVIVVHDVGLQGERLFVAMEHVEGITLGKWMGQHDGPRGHREVLEVFLAAGRGLAAAHAAGLVHRDFKPENVMLANDGRVLVLDFGLARAVDQDEVRPSSEAGAQLVWLATPTTRTGALVGTPAYMAPEQFEGRADARSDQFAFCVALYEALHGQRPFAGENAFELCTAVTHGELRDPPKGTKVPTWLHRVVVRGLATAPTQRWASVGELLAALQDDPSARRRKWLVGGAVLTVLALGGLGARLYVDARAERCRGAAARLEGVWDDTRRAQVRDALTATGVAFADSTWERVEERVDASTQAWVDARNEACRATQRAEQSAELLDLRMHCYDRWLDGLTAQLDVLANADATVAREAASAVSNLPSLDACADADALRDEHPLPSDPDARARIDDALHGLDRVWALERAAKLEDAAAAAGELVAEGMRLEYPPLLAQALMVRGNTLVALGEVEDGLAVLEHGYEVALGSRLVDESAAIAGLLVAASSVRLGDDDMAARWALHARALERASHTPRVRATVLGNLGSFAFEQGRLDEAGQLYARAATLMTQALGWEHPVTARCLNNLGNVAVRNGELGRARESFQQALEIMERTLGPDHPDIVATSSNLSQVLAMEGHRAEAKVLAERALALAERTLSADDPLEAALLVNLAVASDDPAARRSYLEQALAIYRSTAHGRIDDQVPVLHDLALLALRDGRYEDARGYWEQALHALEGGARSEELDIGGALRRLGDVARQQRLHDRAQELYMRALEWQRTNLGAEHQEVAITLNNLGTTLHALGRYEAARSHHAQALAIREKVLAADHPHMSYSWTGLGLALTELGRADEAVPLLERALELRTRQQSAARLRGEASFGLARALWARGATEDRARARALATAARDAYAEVDGRFETKVAEVEAWLRDVTGAAG
jgi:tetratricopeptide (TPR) repeat protein/tRNA A-37 threonylcarbamoyl transferase component Bud32